MPNDRERDKMAFRLALTAFVARCFFAHGEVPDVDRSVSYESRQIK